MKKLIATIITLSVLTISVSAVEERKRPLSEGEVLYEGNMVLENGKYYTQDGVTYVCTRDTVTAVYHALGELVGMYVEVVTT